MTKDNLDNKDEIMDVITITLENVALKADIKSCKKNNSKLLQQGKELIKELKESEFKRLHLEHELQIFKSSFDSNDEVTNLKSQLLEFKKLFGNTEEIYKVWDELQNLRLSDKIQKEIITQRDYIPVTQFNDLYWGDNYPALKVLFDYLQRMNCIDINWSYFCNCMCVGNFTIINLKSTILGKHALAYLLAIIKKYFKDDCNGSQEKYLSIVSRKFTIDNDIITKQFFDKYIREYKKGGIPKKLRKPELDSLSSKIASAYH